MTYSKTVSWNDCMQKSILQFDSFGRKKYWNWNDENQGNCFTSYIYKQNYNRMTIAVDKRKKVQNLIRFELRLFGKLLLNRANKFRVRADKIPSFESWISCSKKTLFPTKWIAADSSAKLQVNPLLLEYSFWRRYTTYGSNKKGQRPIVHSWLICPRCGPGTTSVLNITIAEKNAGRLSIKYEPETTTTVTHGSIYQSSEGAEYAFGKLQ